MAHGQLTAAESVCKPLLWNRQSRDIQFKVYNNRVRSFALLDTVQLNFWCIRGEQVSQSLQTVALRESKVDCHGTGSTTVLLFAA